LADRLGAAGRGSLHAIERVFDAFRARPLGIAVFAGSVFVLVYLQVQAQGAIRADAVARGQQVDHPARVASFVTAVYVRPGDSVAAGAPLVDLSPHFIDRELAQLDAEVEKLLHESALAQARLLVEEQRWLSPSMRLRPDRPSLEKPTEALYAKELALLQTRRRQLLEDRVALTVKSSRAGRVVTIAALGSAVGAGSSVASLTLEFAQEIVAYVPSNTQPESISVGAPVRISRPARGCTGVAEVLRRGAAVEEAPGQLRGLLRLPVHGMPVYISIPPGCNLGIGQVLTVEFTRAVM
jgi:multidrug efflux pump subunit AcrA (membrane-fusion protein)